MDIKMDSDRDRIHQRNQGKFSSDATEPLKKLKPDYDLSYLRQTPIDSEYKKVIRQDKKRSQDTFLKNIDDITQRGFPRVYFFSRN